MNKQKTMAKLFSFRYWLVDFIRVTGAIPTLLWYRPKIIYENKAAKDKIRGGALLISNHNCFFDPIYIMLGVWYRRHHIICNQKFFDTKARWFLKNVMCIPIDIENTGFATMQEIHKHLTSGELVSMFPEGHINDGSGNLRQFKSGMVLMALRSKVPIIPVFLTKHTPLYSRLRIVIGEAVDIEKRFPDRPSMSDIDKLTEELFDKENKLKSIAESR